jgi:intein-encoded DNA endonuclease-like protein
MARTSTFAAHDQHLDGGLTAALTRWRAEGLTYEQITDRLRDELGIDVVTTTVLRWCRRLEQESA